METRDFSRCLRHYNEKHWEGFTLVLKQPRVLSLCHEPCWRCLMLAQPWKYSEMRPFVCADCAGRVGIGTASPQVTSFCSSDAEMHRNLFISISLR